MKLKISESKIRSIVNEGILKQNLNKSIKEQKWPTYTAYLAAELMQLEWKQNLQEGDGEQKPSPEWIAETASAFGLSEIEIAEATEIMDSEELEEGVGGFLKAIAKPYQNIWQTFTNITQHAANLTDPEAQQAAGTLDKIDDQLPSAEELPQQMAQAAQESPEQLGAMIKELIALLRAADSKVDLDDVKPGLEQGVDDAQAELEAAAEELPAAVGGEEGAEGGEGGGEAFVYKGKGGKGLQSFLARGSKQAKKLKGKAMGAVLKHIEKQLKAQGVTVHEGILDEVQGWMWYGLVESAMQEQYGTKITIQEILSEVSGLGRKSAAGKGKGSLARTSSIRSARQSLAREKGMKGAIAGEEPAPDGPEGLSPDTPAEEAPIEEVPPTVKNTAPEGAPKIKVFRGKGGEGLQSALAKNRDALGIDQQTVAVIIKSVEQWAQANQIKVENVTAETFDSIISEVVPKFRARKLQETINKLKNV